MFVSQSIFFLQYALFSFFQSSSALPREIESRQSSGSRAVGYYANWDIYARNYQPYQLPASKLTHVLYAFANIDGTTGNVSSSDTYADYQKHFPGDSWTEPGNNVYGCIKQLFLLKKANRNMKTILSIGGYTYSPNFPTPLSTSKGRNTFVSSAVSMLANLGFDGLDIDYEYPANAQQAADFVTTLKLLRQRLNALETKIKVPAGTFLITVASPAGPSHYEIMNLAGMDQHVDFWNLMAYDYAGSWSTLTGHDANVYPSTKDSGSTPFNTQQALNYYTSQGKIAASKINIGIPLYGRSFAGTTGMGQPFTGVGQGTWEAGVYDWKALPIANTTSQDDLDVLGSWTYSKSSKELVSYDSMAIMKLKAKKALALGLGGLMWWELSGDKNGTGSAVAAQVNILSASGGLEKSQNNLHYPTSVYTNLRAGMPSTS